MFALLGTSGCSTLFKDDYWDRIRDQSDRDELARIRDDPTSGFFLGVRASTAESAWQLGIQVQHVYAESPAARAGLLAGDEIRAIDQYPVRTPGDARWVLSSLWKTREREELQDRENLARSGEKVTADRFAPHFKTRIVFVRNDHEIESEIDLTSREGYLELRRRRVYEFSHFEQHGYNSFYLSKKRTLPPDLVWTYFGVKVDEDVLVLEDTDYVPLIFGISFFRMEVVPVADAKRITVICSLLQFSDRGDDRARTLVKLIPEAPADSTDL
jgi:hypothetical protein